jgi:hypothetical protein
MNIWRKAKLKDCLKAAARDYKDRENHLARRYEEQLVPTSAPDAGTTVANLFVGTLGTNLAGFLLRVAVLDAYYIPKTVVAKQNYERDVADCHSFYDPR